MLECHAPMKPMIGYYGGKQRIVRHILPHISPHKVYVEPFCGGATVFWSKGRPDTKSCEAYREILNDTNNNLINMYRVAKTKPDELNNMIQATLYSRSEYYKAKAVLENPHEHDEITRAWAMYVNASQSFASNLASGWAYGVRGQNDTFTFSNQKERLLHQLKRLEQTHLDNRDALEIIRRWDSRDTFFYCDPPYPNTNQGHYSGYTQADFEALIEVSSSIQGSFVLSCYDNPFVPKDWVKFQIETVASAMNMKYEALNNKRIECLWVVHNREG